MNFVYNVNLVAARVRGKKNLVLDLAHIINARIGSTVNLYNIKGRTSRNLLTSLTLATGTCCWALLAVQRLCQNACRGSLTTTARPRKQISVGNLPGSNRIPKSLGNKFLPDQIFKSLRPSPGRRNFISHKLRIP